jgi:Rad3-related DNA helicase
MEFYKEFYLCLTGDVQAELQRGESYGKFYQFTPSLILNNDTRRLLLKYATGSGKTLAAIIIANKYKKMDKRVLIISYMESRLNEDIITFYKYANITQEQKNALDKKEKMYIDNKSDTTKAQYLLYRRKLINSVGIDIVGYKKFHNFVVGSDGGVKIEYIEGLKNSVIICDEIHNTYS